MVNIKSILFRRIKNGPFTVVHYIGLALILYYPKLLTILSEHARGYFDAEHLRGFPLSPIDIKNNIMMMFVFVILCYSIKRVFGYLLAVVYMGAGISNASGIDVFSFDLSLYKNYDMTPSLKDHIATGLEYREIVEGYANAIHIFLISMLLAALALSISNYVKERKGKKNEPVNPELEIERRNQ